MLKWFRSLLSDCFQFVKINGSTTSEYFKVTSGVPQGSHCALTLFNATLNQSKHLLRSVKESFYADDAKLCMPITDPICIR